MIDVTVILRFLERVVREYETSAPAVSRWADSLYIRINENLYSVYVVELLQAQALLDNDIWEHPNMAANRIYKLMNTLGQDVTGLAGY